MGSVMSFTVYVTLPEKREVRFYSQTLRLGIILIMRMCGRYRAKLRHEIDREEAFIASMEDEASLGGVMKQFDGKPEMLVSMKKCITVSLTFVFIHWSVT